MKELEKLKVGKLPKDIYMICLENCPIPTVDFVICKNGSFLLIKRNEGAFTNDWFVLGGRQNRGERIEETLQRIAEREIGLNPEDVISVRFSHRQDVFNHSSTNSEGDLPDWHSIWQFHIIEVRETFNPKLDSTSSDFGWFNQSNLPEIPDEVKEALQRSNLVK